MPYQKLKGATGYSLFTKEQRGDSGWKLTGPPPARATHPAAGDGQLSRRLGTSLGYPSQGSVRHAGDAVAFKCLSSLSDTRSPRNTHPGLYFVGKERSAGGVTRALRDGRVVPLWSKRPLPRFTRSVIAGK